MDPLTTLSESFSFVHTSTTTTSSPAFTAEPWLSPKRISTEPTLSGCKLLHSLPLSNFYIKGVNTATHSILQLWSVLQKEEAVFELRLEEAIVNMTLSSNGQLCAVSCCDGTLYCINLVSANNTPSMTVRWVLSNACSSTPTLSSGEREETAACASGPIHSLSFEPNGYKFLLVDAASATLRLYNGAAEKGDMIYETNQIEGQGVSAADWSPDGLMVAVGGMQ
eukprot:11756965-Ditylum_brightwellii.AAC.1